ncbi:MAG: chloride channel protein [Magnetococcales bacterium]|nr:chloride channel protein [Magnetococcales bacterium]
MLNFLKRLGVNEQITLSGIAVFIGIMVGYGAILFRRLIDFFQFIFMGSGDEDVVTILEGLSWWHILLMPAVGGLIIGPLVHFLLPGARGDGVPEVMAAVALRGGKINAKDGLGKIVACALSIGSGGSVGREGPVVHLGATIASWFGGYLNMTTKHMRTMVGCGVAAGIAASFNAPIAGVMFSLEVIMGDYGLTTFSPIVLSAVIATVVARVHLGDFPAFVVPHYTLVSVWEIPAYVGLGLVCGLTGILFMHTLFKTEDWIAKISVPIYFKPMLGGLMVGLIALMYPQIMGVGYDTMNHALQEEMPGMVMLTLVFIKIVATAITLGSGFSGGVFTPSLFLGAMVGGAYGTYAHSLFPALSAGPGAYSLVGMGAMCASVLGAPITSILVLFELTRDYRIMLSLMVSSIVASLLINQIYHHSVFTRALSRKDINLHSHRESNLLRDIPVGAIMRRSCPIVADTTTLHRIKEMIHQSREEFFLVKDGSGAIKGTLSFREMRGVTLQEDLEYLLLVRDIPMQKILTALPTDDLFETFRQMGTEGIEQVVVISQNDPSQVLGVLTNHDVIRAYNTALMDRESGQSESWR